MTTLRQDIAAILWPDVNFPAELLTQSSPDGTLNQLEQLFIKYCTEAKRSELRLLEITDRESPLELDIPSYVEFRFAKLKEGSRDV